MTTMQTFDHVEDYIEIISGMRTIDGKRVGLFDLHKSPLNLARYDVNMVESLAYQTLDGTAYTDKQSQLALNIALKYERQLHKLGIDVSHLNDKPAYRMPVRVVDRSKKVWAEEEHIYLRFPYDATMIEAVRSAAKDIPGTLRFDRQKRLWVAGLNESTVTWVHTYALMNGFEIDPSLTELVNKIAEVEKTSYAIELQSNPIATELNIVNAASSLNEYIEEHLGGFSSDNLLTLVDNAPLLGYTTNKVIEEVVISCYGTRFWSLCANRELKADASKPAELVKQVLEYADTTKRLPVYVYEPDLSNKLLNIVSSFVDSTAIVRNEKDINKNTKVVYVTTIPKTGSEKIPLLVTSGGMLYGGDRQVWVQRAEKIVYFTNDVYTKGNAGGKKLCKLS